MLRLIVGILFFTSILTASNSVVFGHKKRIYTIQILSLIGDVSPQKYLKNVPKSLRLDIHFFRKSNSKYTAVYYSKAQYTKSLQKVLKKIQKLGYKDAFILSVPLTRFQKETIKKRGEQISKYTISKLITKANEAYKKADESRATMYYEMLLSAGLKSSNIKNNLCYLYGKQGAWEEAKNIIDNDRYPARLIYAYANGAVTTSQKSFYNDLRDYILLDRSGHLDLLAGYYFEEKNNLKKAFEFYKKAYEKNRNDIYNTYAYARFLDISRKKKEASELYENLYERTSEDNAVHKAVKIRLHQQGSFL